MPLLLRHLMPLIVIGVFFIFSVVCTLLLLTVIGRMFGRQPKALRRGPVIEGQATEVREPAILPGSDADIGRRERQAGG